MKKLLIINIEIKSREFISRMMIAYEALKQDFEIIIGAQDQLLEIIFNLPSGIFFEKSISKNKHKLLKKIRENGHKIVNLDEEGLASQNNTHFYLKQRISKENLDLVEYFFTWGINEKKLLQDKYKEDKNKFKVTGNPRIDSWKSVNHSLYKKELEIINDKYKNYIFITSNFASVNHAAGENFRNKQISDFKIVETGKDYKIMNSNLVFKKKMFKSFLDMIKKLSTEFPNNQIVLRPHPSDNINEWKLNLAEYKNIFIEYKFSSTPWIISSKCMIHSSCTTGIEGFFFNKPVFSYLPYKDHNLVNFVSNNLSDVCDNFFELSKKISSVLDGYYSNKNIKKKDLIRSGLIIDNINNNHTAKKIIKFVQNIKTKDYKSLSLDYLKLLKLKFFFKRFLKKLFKTKKINKEYSIQKMPGITLNEVYDKLNQIEKIESKIYTNNFYVKEIYKNVFLIKKNY